MTEISRKEILAKVLDIPPVSGSKKEISPNVTRIRTAGQVLQDAKTLPEIKQIFGTNWHTGEIAFLAGDTGIGKSVLGVHIGNLIASSQKYFINHTCDIQNKILYYDFELSDRQFENRFKGYSFSDDLYRVDINPKCIDVGFTLEQINNDLEATGANIIIIDNLTALSMKNVADPDVAMNIMRGLKKLQIEKGTSSLILAHVPKILPGTSLNINHLAGSKHLSNFADSVFFIARSSIGNSFRYIKQVKARNSELSPNVVVCEIIKQNDYLNFQFVKYDDEYNHLALEQDVKTEERKELQQRAFELREEGKTIRAIAEELHVGKSTVERWIKNCPSVPLNGTLGQEELKPFVPVSQLPHSMNGTGQRDNQLIYSYMDSLLIPGHSIEFNKNEFHNLSLKFNMDYASLVGIFKQYCLERNVNLETI